MSPRRGGPNWRSALRLLVSLAFIGLLLRIVDLRQVISLLKSADPALLLAAAGVAIADRGLMALKWYPLLRAQLPTASMGSALKAYWASSFASVILPSTIGGDAVRAFALGRASRSVVEVGASIVTERLLGMVASGFLCILALAFAYGASLDTRALLPWALLAVVLAFGVLALPLIRWRVWDHWEGERRAGSRWGDILRRFAAAQQTYRHHTGVLFWVGALTLVEQTIPIWVFFFLSAALDLGISLKMLVVAVPLTLFVSRFPIAVWGLGVVELSLVYLLGLFGVHPAQALALGLAGRIVELISVLPGAFLWQELARGAARTPLPEPERNSPLSRPE